MFKCFQINIMCYIIMSLFDYPIYKTDAIFGTGLSKMQRGLKFFIPFLDAMSAQTLLARLHKLPRAQKLSNAAN